jgi:hypothetical protein
MPDHYASSSTVIARTGVQPADLGLLDDEELATFVAGLLAEVTDLMNRKLGRDYLAELEADTITAIPAGLHGIAADIAADSLRTMVATRQTPVVRIDDFAVATIRTKMLSDDVKERLRLYGRSGARSLTLTNR